eukprot:1972757-Prymnesium_polylepis.1
MWGVRRTPRRRQRRACVAPVRARLFLWSRGVTLRAGRRTFLDGQRVREGVVWLAKLVGVGHVEHVREVGVERRVESDRAGGRRV